MSGQYRIPKLTILPSAGSFSKLSDQLWFYCREEFHWINTTTRQFLFAHRKDFRKGNVGTTERIAEFIGKIETKLKVEPRSVLRPTQYLTISYVKMSPWWRFSIRRSLFTALLRAAQFYDGKNFYYCLFSSELGRNNYYTRDTEKALRRFFRGFTNYTGNVQGWWDAFFGNSVYAVPSAVQLRKLLIKPE